MSFSRSFWLAGILSLVAFLILLLIQRERFGRVFYFGILSVVIATIGAGLTLGVAAFPIPPGTSGGSSIFKERVEKFKEAAASSRMSQIRPLLTAIAKHPAIGSGFGQTVTYQSQDPRVVKSHPGGWYTTMAFELGWLEMWLKLGLLGVLAYLYLLWRILKAGWIIVRHPERAERVEGSQGLPMGRYLVLGSLAGLIAIVITHGVSPYLNHPLGIGIVILLTAILANKDNNQRKNPYEGWTDEQLMKWEVGAEDRLLDKLGEGIHEASVVIAQSKNNYKKLSQVWKLLWDISATIVGLYFGYKIFIFSGEHIPAFGYFPIGLILGLLVLGIGAYAVHGLELLFSWFFYKLFKIRAEDDLPF